MAAIPGRPEYFCRNCRSYEATPSGIKSDQLSDWRQRRIEAELDKGSSTGGAACRY